MEVFNINNIEVKKRYLKRYRKNKTMIARLSLKLETIDDRITSVRSPSWSDMPKGCDPITLDDLLSDKIELENRIAKLELKGRQIKREICDAIDTLDDPRYADVAECFFIDCMRFEDISCHLGFTERYVRKLYMRSIENIDIPDIEQFEVQICT